MYEKIKKKKNIKYKMLLNISIWRIKGEKGSGNSIRCYS